MSVTRARHIIATAACIAVAITCVADEEDDAPVELRGIWVPNTDCAVLDSKENVEEAVAFLDDVGFNVVFPVVWSKGRTLFPSEVAKKAFGVAIDPRYEGRDPLQEMIDAAHARGMAVIPWFEYGFAAAYKDITPDLFRKQPKWAARDRDGDVVEKNGFRWMNSLDPRVQRFVRDLVLEVVDKYDIDGIQGDDRLPAMPSEGGYDRATRAAYRRDTGRKAPQDPKDADWLRWRADKLTAFLAELRHEVHERKPGLVVSCSPGPPSFGYREYLQDSVAWIDQGLADLLHPQAYRHQVDAYFTLMETLLDDHYGRPPPPALTPGVLIKTGSFLLPPDDLVRIIGWNREQGLAGEVLFHYQGLRDDDDAIADALREGPYAERARLPFPLAGAVK